MNADGRRFFYDNSQFYSDNNLSAFMCVILRLIIFDYADLMPFLSALNFLP